MPGMDNPMLNLIFSSIGMGFFLYGYKQKHWSSLVCGVFLMAYTYVITNFMLALGIGVVLSILPFVVKR